MIADRSRGLKIRLTLTAVRKLAPICGKHVGYTITGDKQELLYLLRTCAVTLCSNTKM